VPTQWLFVISDTLIVLTYLLTNLIWGNYEKWASYTTAESVCVCLLKPKGQIDLPEEFVSALNSSEFRGDKRCKVISALKVALTNNPVSYVDLKFYQFIRNAYSCWI